MCMYCVVFFLLHVFVVDDHSKLIVWTSHLMYSIDLH